MSYAYDEGKMMEAIEVYRKEKKAAGPSIVGEPRPIASAIAGEAIALTAKRLSITPELMASSCREAPAVRAREVVVLVLRRKYGYSLTRIGRILGRHHTTIMYLEECGNENYKKYPSFSRIVDEVSGSCTAVIRDEMGIPIEAA